MVEKALVDGLLLIKEAATGDLTADVTDADPPWVDLSSKALTYNIADTRANGSTRPHGANPRVRVSAGAVSGTINITCLRDSAELPIPKLCSRVSTKRMAGCSLPFRTTGANLFPGPILSLTPAPPTRSTLQAPLSTASIISAWQTATGTRLPWYP